MDAGNKMLSKSSSGLRMIPTNEASSSPFALEEPAWIPDKQVTECLGCKRVFDFFNRRHHCRRCGKCYCSNCCSHNLLLQRMYFIDPVRQCYECSILSKAEEEFYDKGLTILINDVMRYAEKVPVSIYGQCLMPVFQKGESLFMNNIAKFSSKFLNSIAVMITFLCVTTVTYILYIIPILDPSRQVSVEDKSWEGESPKELGVYLCRLSSDHRRIAFTPSKPLPRDALPPPTIHLNHVMEMALITNTKQSPDFMSKCDTCADSSTLTSIIRIPAYYFHGLGHGLKVYYKDDEDTSVSHCIQLNPVDERSVPWIEWVTKALQMTSESKNQQVHN